MSVGVFDVVVDRMVVGGDRLERRGVASVRVRLGARKMSPTLRSSNVRGSTTVKVAGSNWSRPDAVGWVIVGTPYVELVRIGSSVAVSSEDMGLIGLSLERE
jgi:hypothetical protein